MHYGFQDSLLSVHWKTGDYTDKPSFEAAQVSHQSPNFLSQLSIELLARVLLQLGLAHCEAESRVVCQTLPRPPIKVSTQMS